MIHFEVVDVDSDAAVVAVGETGKLALGDGNDAIKITRRRRRDTAAAGEADKTAAAAAQAESAEAADTEEQQFPDAQGVS